MALVLHTAAMSARIPLLALVALVTVWAALAVVRDAQIGRHATAVQAAQVAGYIDTVEFLNETHYADLIRLAGDHPEVAERAAVRDTVAMQEATYMPAVRSQQDSLLASLGVERDPATGHVIAPREPEALAAVPSRWFHGAFGTIAALLALVALTAPRP